MSKSKAKGTLAETAVVRYLRERGFDVHRQVLTGSSDQGDIRGLPVAVEVKNCATVAMPAWLREAAAEAVNAGLPLGVVVNHPRGQGRVEGWHVTMTLEDFATLMKQVAEFGPKETACADSVPTTSGGVVYEPCGVPADFQTPRHGFPLCAEHARGRKGVVPLRLPADGVS